MRSIRRKILIDTDLGIGLPQVDIDDGVAIVLAAVAGELEICGLATVFGNVCCNRATINAVNLRKMLKRDFPIARGCSGPIGGRDLSIKDRGILQTDKELPFEASSALCKNHAVDFIIKEANRADGELMVVAIGPLTNLGMALVKEPELAKKIKEVILMGGSAGAGNVTPVAEFNLLNDPEAADIVFRSGVPLTMIGLDVTTSIRIKEETIRPWKDNRSELIGFLYNATYRWMIYRSQVRNEPDIGCYFHDVMTIAYLLDKTLFTAKSAHVDIELNGKYTRGMTVVDQRVNTKQIPNVNLITAVDGEHFLPMIVSKINAFYK